MGALREIKRIFFDPGSTLIDETEADYGSARRKHFCRMQGWKSQIYSFISFEKYLGCFNVFSRILLYNDDIINMGGFSV